MDLFVLASTPTPVTGNQHLMHDAIASLSYRYTSTPSIEFQLSITGASAAYQHEEVGRKPEQYHKYTAATTSHALLLINYHFINVT